MSSIISHVYIGNILKEEYNLGDEFLYGSILPDMLAKSINAQTREMTHYLRHGILYGVEGDFPDVERYINENKDLLPRSKMLQGYLAHLIEDMLWFSVYLPKIAVHKDNNTFILKKNNSIHSNDEFWKIMYSDYTIMDKHLLNKSNINIEELRAEFLQITEDENLRNTINENFKQFETKRKSLIFLSKEIFEKYIKASLEKVSLVLDKIYR